MKNLPKRPTLPVAKFEPVGISTDKRRGKLQTALGHWITSLILHAVLLLVLGMVILPSGVGSLGIEFFAEIAENDRALDSSIDITLADFAPTTDPDLNEPPTLDTVIDVPALDSDESPFLDLDLLEPKKEKVPEERPMSDSGKKRPSKPKMKPQNSGSHGMKKANAVQAATGVAGVIQKIGKDIAASLESNRTLVVWLFDQSPSLITQRAEILDQLTDIYSESGGLAIDQKVSFTADSRNALLTQVSAFGQGFDQALTKPVSTFKPVARSIRSILRDDSGIENVMGGVLETVSRYRNLGRIDKDTGSRKCNVVIVVITDEAGDDIDRVEEAIAACQRVQVPVYVIGVPAPFGEQTSEVLWTDPDVPNSPTVPAFVNQGPESLVFERVAASCRRNPPFAEGPIRQEELRKLLPPPVDSGFGPYALTLLCRETGGIYFAVHPNRENSAGGWQGIATFSSHLTQFYSPNVMESYQPDYLPARDFFDMLGDRPLRQAVVAASKLSTSGELILRTECKFLKNSFERGPFLRQIANEKRVVSAYGKRLESVYRDLKAVEGEYELEESRRWRANYQLALATVECALARLYSWTAFVEFLDKRRPSFDRANVSRTNNVMTIHESEELIDDAQIHSMVKLALERCRNIIEEHPGTPWATLAEWEMNIPFGFSKTEYYIPPGKRPGPRPTGGGPTPQRL